ncbi:MAG: 16S rRNA (uracil(1498)-N(3))-methyltransferase [Candidatus Omnitrophica bacterium]|nr:16S rRNA (uracil(1498)-N(3))-methyltransferase [Candidatus Omnitrophota bacterium]
MPQLKARCYIPSDAWEGNGRLRLSGREAHHLSRVLRIKPGDWVSCFDGAGTEAVACVRSVDPRAGIDLEIKEKKRLPPLSGGITLASAIPQSGKIDQIIDQATQFGVRRIIPVTTARGVVRISQEDSKKKLLRWNRIAVEAAKQSKVSHLPLIDPALPWDRLVCRFKEFDLALVAAVEGPHEPLAGLLKGRERSSILLIIGPEGDLTPEELAQADAAGARRFSLGPTVLRCETAAVAALSLISYVLRGGMENE